ncbi:WAP four-disulfide core domain protein 5-like isoform X2 [Mauremys reevesii]|uniref:WAP four-disulfide core domain protein 5-like isoform X1 n=1 Tax=Mauremys reevesii TaxID=260615 RepID=UPI00193F4540|nr:WAP four-disulfide core domain protein 5-like isoform X1 [Mauremys reevesii]XP_039354780.1 WAP four-disulfide core domain protein 5-like isoform X2 [Mauremys reevesii]
MQSVGVLLLVGLLTLWTELPAASGQKKEKPGTCPPDDIRCIRAEPDECAKDSECRGKQKCCHFFCAMRCVDPVKKKPGTCPPDNIRCIRAEPDECAMDSECRGKQKCCHSFCAMRCVDPVKT